MVQYLQYVRATLHGVDPLLPCSLPVIPCTQSYTYSSHMNTLTSRANCAEKRPVVQEGAYLEPKCLRPHVRAIG